VAAASKGGSVNIKRHGAKTAWQAVMAAKSRQARGVARMQRTLMLRGASRHGGGGKIGGIGSGVSENRTGRRDTAAWAKPAKILAA
jgi:hypothetical protein